MCGTTTVPLAVLKHFKTEPDSRRINSQLIGQIPTSSKQLPPFESIIRHSVKPVTLLQHMLFCESAGDPFVGLKVCGGC